MNEGCWHSKTFCHFLLWRREFCFDVVCNFELKKMTPNCNALAKSIISYLWVSYYEFVFSWQCKTMSLTKKINMQWRHRSVRIAIRGINKKGVEIGERQNRCHDDTKQTQISLRLRLTDTTFRLSLSLQHVYKQRWKGRFHRTALHLSLSTL